LNRRRLRVGSRLDGCDSSGLKSEKGVFGARNPGSDELGAGGISEGPSSEGSSLVISLVGGRRHSSIALKDLEKNLHPGDGVSKLIQNPHAKGVGQPLPNPGALPFTYDGHHSLGSPRYCGKLQPGFERVGARDMGLNRDRPRPVRKPEARYGQPIRIGPGFLGFKNAVPLGHSEDHQRIHHRAPVRFDGPDGQGHQRSDRSWRW